MKKMNVTVFIQGVYNSSIDVPDDLTLEEALEYAKKHMEDIPMGAVDYIPGSETLDEDNCDF